MFAFTFRNLRSQYSSTIIINLSTTPSYIWPNMEMFQKVLHLSADLGGAQNKKCERRLRNHLSTVKATFLRYANTCSSCLTYIKNLFQAFFTLCGCLSFFNFSILAICKPCRLRLTRTDTRLSGSPEPPDLGENSKLDISSSIVFIFDQCMSEQMNN